MYYILLFFLYPLSLLPLRVMYALSDIGNFLLFRVFRYRKQIVSENLQHAFPEKTPEALDAIARQFYRSFCDQWVETLKLLSMPLPALKQRITGNFELFDNLYDSGRNVYALLGHQFNWEWGNVVTQLHIKAQFAGIYLPQNAAALDRLLLRLRSRSGSMMISALNMKPAFKALKERKHVISFMADQTPGSLRIADWFMFLNRPAPFFKTPEKAAVQAEAAVVFVGISKIKRGHYQVTLTKLCENAAAMPPGELTRQYVRHLEKELTNAPANWMWTHRRWKRSLPEGQALADDRTN